MTGILQNIGNFLGIETPKPGIVRTSTQKEDGAGNTRFENDITFNGNSTSLQKTMEAAGLDPGLLALNADPQKFFSESGDSPKITPIGKNGYSAQFKDDSGAITLMTVAIDQTFAGNEKQRISIVKFNPETKKFETTQKELINNGLGELKKVYDSGESNVAMDSSQASSSASPKAFSMSDFFQNAFKGSQQPEETSARESSYHAATKDKSKESHWYDA